MFSKKKKGKPRLMVLAGDITWIVLESREEYSEDPATLRDQLTADVYLTKTKAGPSGLLPCKSIWRAGPDFALIKVSEISAVWLEWF